MSQAKVDRYKEEKRNRAKTMAREKRNWMLTKLCGALAAVVIVGWAGFSVYQNFTAPQEHDHEHVEVTSYDVDLSAINDYVGSIAVD